MILINGRRILSHDFQRESSFPPPPPPPATATAGVSSGAKISPALLFIIVILAVIFFISGLLHLLVRFLIKQSPSSSPENGGRRHRREILGSEALQRQLQQLFHLHDSGLDQAAIDALPVFLYGEIVGSKEPFDCAVCLCEFAAGDKLRLLPVCSHAFHIACIDAWLLCNSSCPLCRGTLFVPGQPIENPVFDLDDDGGGGGEEREGLAAGGKRVLPVRLGKFRAVGGGGPGGAAVGREEGETSSSCLGARRCYSMGRTRRRSHGTSEELGRRSPVIGDGDGGGGGRNGKRLWAGSKDESFSVSKIWQWPNKKEKFPLAAVDCSSFDGGSPWVPAAGGKGADS
ncbi:unnamed protein product [Spirodela intermedia]|uniref:RING-type E3 ubiquitin transferase n=1 Tax=Spirodela intermedia TaxID=51605 RepID=A0A7I8ITY0_SPIIN|nr:unnamed protein product [Spirodela intermedia]CAA6661484.1 unnamed protein product [Spirodela intermedia]